MNYISKKTLAFGAYLNKKNTIDFNGISMSPLINDGERVIVDIHSSNFSLGDIIIVMDTNHELVCHRVISLSPLITKGDRSLVDDKTQSIVGVVTHILKKDYIITTNKRDLIKRTQTYLSNKNRRGILLRKGYLVVNIILSLIEIKISKTSLKNHIQSL